ncbi:MAG: hypothetical protein F6K17_06990 [Okeania sp. SIO3C4]|nr:hypothetical protein [Okeania sp. SIO3C4]
MDNYVSLKAIPDRELLKTLWGAGEQGAGEKGEIVIVARQNYLTSRNKCTFQYIFYLEKAFTIL